MKIKTSASVVSHAAGINPRGEAAHSKQEKNANRFASALDKIINSPPESEAECGAGARLEDEPKAQQPNDDDLFAAAPSHGGTPEAMRSRGAPLISTPAILLSRAPEIEPPPVAPLFPAADVERIVHGLRTSIGIDGSPEITLEFSRSVAGGLLVQFNADAAGRVKITLSTASAGSRADVEARLPSLIEQLHARGVETAQVKVSIGGSSVGHGRERPPPRRQQERLPDRPLSAVKNRDAPRADVAPTSGLAEMRHSATYLA